METNVEAPLFERLGGSPAIEATVEEFYRRVLADDLLKAFFNGLNMTALKKKQVDFFTQALGGPANYQGRDMESSHEYLGIASEHFDAVAGHLVGTLQSLNVSQDLIDEVVSVVAPLKDIIVTEGKNAGEKGSKTKRRKEMEQGTQGLDYVNGNGKQSSLDASAMAMVENAPVNIILANKDLTITYLNPSSSETLQTLAQYLPISPEQMVGASIDIFHKDPAYQRKILANPANLPHRATIQIGPETADLLVTAIYDKNNNYVGPMVTWEVNTEKLQLERQQAMISAMV
ncbi:MAG: hypothetical protein KDD62_15650, partial [Bdellovibrionales bacterium]|nr:hypothetical protein [Bdellovibrionales bacterium]